MSGHRKPKKPVRNPTHFLFSETGTVRPVVEEFPREQEALEFTVGRKFLGALQHFEGVQFHDLCRGSEPADLACKSPDGDTIGLQVVEVLTPQLQKLRHMRSVYRDALKQALGEALLLFNGCRVMVADIGDPPYLPPLSSPSGQAWLQVITEHVRQVAKEVQTLDVGKIRLRDTRTQNPERKVSLVVERILPAGQPVRLEFTWAGSGTYISTDFSQGLLIKAVESKIAKRYAKPAVGKFVLLVYSIDTLLRDNDPDISKARRILETSQHPFDDVWFIYLYPDQELGALVHIWPVHDTDD